MEQVPGFAKFSIFCMNLGPVCYVLHHYGAVLLRSATIWPPFAPSILQRFGALLHCSAFCVSPSTTAKTEAPPGPQLPSAHSRALDAKLEACSKAIAKEGGTKEGVIKAAIDALAECHAAEPSRFLAPQLRKAAELFRVANRAAGVSRREGKVEAKEALKKEMFTRRITLV